MPRDMRGTGRYPPQPRFPPFAFFSAVRLGDPELLGKIMQADPYFVTQDNGAGAPLHFAVTHRQLDMAHHLLNNGAAVNQRETGGAGWTPLHRAAQLAHLDGYLEIYEYLLSRGADPSLLSRDERSYLNPGPKSVIDVAVEDEAVRSRLRELNERYKDVPKAPLPHADVGDWWALYDYGLPVVATWPHDYEPPYPEVAKRRRDREAARAARAARKAAAAAALQVLAADGFARPFKPGAAPPLAAGSDPSAGAGPEAAAPAAVAGAGGEPAAAQASLPLALLFPGQGSQAVGMLGAGVAGMPSVRAMVDEASRLLGYDLLGIITDGLPSALDDTAVAQPALFVANLAALEVLRGREPDAVDRPRAAAGLSLGEYSALVAAGALSFSDGLKVVKARGAAMAAAAAVPPGGRAHGMLSVVGVSDADLAELCSDAAQRCGPGTVCRVANYLFPQGRVVSGHTDALDLVAAGATRRGALKAARLAVSGAFHTSLMEPAREALMQVLREVELRAPAFPVLSNVTAAPFPPEPDAIRELLGRQLVEPVRWEDSLCALLAQPGEPGGGAGAAVAAAGAGWAGGVSRLVEVGPGQQIKSMVRRISGDAWRAFTNVNAAA